VYLGAGNSTLTRPVILSDGFHLGETDLNVFWWGLDQDPDGFPFASAIRDGHRDLIILGYDDCTASILHNAEVAIACVKRTIAESPDARLAVGGFSMGGLITRYALAKMETDLFDHRTDLYVSYDSPHHGAWTPISIQALAHVISKTDRTLLDLIDSPAAHQLMRYYLPAELIGEEKGVELDPHPDREIFLQALAAVGSWPQRSGLRRIGVANGRGDGTALPDIKPGEPALRSYIQVGDGQQDVMVLYLQASGPDALVAMGVDLDGGILTPWSVKTSGLPEADGAPGGTLESFGMVADKIEEAPSLIPGLPVMVQCDHRWVSFVPAGSAIAVRDLDIWDNLYTPVNGRDSDLHEYRCAQENGKHTSTNEELCGFIVSQLPPLPS
jgi:hypothetical protein